MSRIINFARMDFPYTHQDIGAGAGYHWTVVLNDGSRLNYHTDGGTAISIDGGKTVYRPTGGEGLYYVGNDGESHQSLGTTQFVLSIDPKVARKQVTRWLRKNY